MSRKISNTSANPAVSQPCRNSAHPNARRMIHDLTVDEVKEPAAPQPQRVTPFQDRPLAVFEEVLDETHHAGPGESLGEHPADRLASLDRMLGHLVIDRGVIIAIGERVDVLPVERVHPGIHKFFRRSRHAACCSRKSPLGHRAASPLAGAVRLLDSDPDATVRAPMQPIGRPGERERGTAAALWEEAVECGACGARRARFAGAIGRRRYAVCLGCGVERLYDRLAENRLDLLYGTYYAPSEPSPAALEQQLANPTFAHRRRRLEQCLAGRTRRILEIGCGDGNFLAVLRRAGWSVHGQEVSADTAALVERRHGVPVTTEPFEILSSDPPFPVVAAYHVFEHIYHPAAWLQRVRQLIEPDGLLHLQVPNAAALTRRLSGEAWSSLVFPQHVYFYEPRTLQSLLNGLGFTVLTTTTWDPWHGPGVITSSLSNVAALLLRGSSPWSDDLVSCPRPPAAPGAAPPARHPLKVFLRGGLERASVGLARLEAAAGRGAVVDIVARRD